MYVSCTIADLQDAQSADEFDAWLHLASIGGKVNLDIPIRFHKQYNKLAAAGKRLNSYIITDKYVQFSFEIETGPKREPVRCFGVDTGINALASLNDGTQFGLDIKECIERVKRCEAHSKGKRHARNALKQRINETVKEVIALNPDLVVVEKLKKLGHKSKLKRRLRKNIRRSIGVWNWRYWLTRLEQACEWNRVSFRTVSPYHTSTTCPECGSTDRLNRVQEMFRCLKCGHEDNADVNAARNILARFGTGPYGACCKPAMG
jgi:putative transposase